MILIINFIINVLLSIVFATWLYFFAIPNVEENLQILKQYPKLIMEIVINRIKIIRLKILIFYYQNKNKNK